MIENGIRHVLLFVSCYYSSQDRLCPFHITAEAQRQKNFGDSMWIEAAVRQEWSTHTLITAPLIQLEPLLHLSQVWSVDLAPPQFVRTPSAINPCVRSTL